MRRLERFSKAEEAILKYVIVPPVQNILTNAVFRVGEDIQDLSRFVGVQRLAFQKLLKKYKKWTSSSDLGQRFQREVLGRPTSFTEKDFEPLLTQWAEVLAAVRAPFKAGTKWRPTSTAETEGSFVTDRTSDDIPRSEKSRGGYPRGSLQRGERSTSNAQEIHSMCESGSNLDFDTALAVLPLGHLASKAVYWIHPDNLIQVHVILLQHTRLHRTDNTASSPPNTSSPKSSRSGSMNSRRSANSNRADEETGVIFCDDLQQFAKRRSSATIGDSENLPGSTSEKAAASVRYCSTGEAVAIINKSSHPREGNVIGKHVFERAKLKLKAIRQLFSTDSPQSSKRRQSCQSGVPNGGAESDSDLSRDIETIQKWFCEHSEIEPLVQLLMRRTRFVGLRNGEIGGLWATIDKDVSMRRFPKGSSISRDDLLTLGEEGKPGFEKFPHAILEIRCEGKTATDLIASLDASHLVRNPQSLLLHYY